MRLVRAIRSPLFFRILRRSLHLRGGHTPTALLALTIAACVATAMLSLYFDLDAKLHKEFRAYGANIIVTAKDSQTLSAETMAKVQSTLPPQAIAIPVGYAVARTSDGTSVVVAGTDLERTKQLNHWWSVSNWPSVSGEALVGERVSRALGQEKSQYTLLFADKPIELSLAGRLKTGSDEENRIYISLKDFERWTGLQPSTLEISMPGSRGEIDAMVKQLQNTLPQVEVRPIRQIVEAEAGVISKTKLLMLAALLLISITVALCVLATLTSSVLERRRDFAVMKALGSSQGVLNVLFASEAILLGVTGAVLGYALGSAIAAWIGQANFHATVLPRFSVFPIILFGNVLIALLASSFPLARLQSVEPAGILKGD